MPLTRKNHTDRIIKLISQIKSEVDTSNSLNLTDINVISENFYRDFLNLCYGYDLKNINIEEQNTAAIDLGDLNKKIAIQVTSTGGLPKTRKTVQSFIEKKLHLKYDRLLILNITNKVKHRDPWIGVEGTYKLDTKTDIIDSNDLARDIFDKKLDDIIKIRSFLDKELGELPSPSASYEVLTFNALIEELSKDHPAAGKGFIEDPDPKGKIEERFANHSDYLKAAFLQLFEEYGKVLKAVRKNSNLGQTRLRRLSMHLKIHSDEVLTEHSGDAEKALSALTNEMENMLSQSGGNFDKLAIKFFLLDELIRCNIFPNKERIHA